MGDPRGFLKFKRDGPERRPVEERVRDWKELYKPISENSLVLQGSRCMDCGVPFCQSETGCPVKNMIPDWNDLVTKGRWKEALKNLHSTNNFPEFTGRLCPAPCEGSCVLGINSDPVSIRVIEWNIIDRGFDEGWVSPVIPGKPSGFKVAVVGSGPAGLAAAQQLARAGHTVTVFEKSDRVGGLLRYGIPDFKMEKWVLDRRLEQMKSEGVVFKTGIEVGTDLTVKDLRGGFDAVCLAGGAQTPRDLQVPGRELGGVHLAMEYLTQQNKINAGDSIDPARRISAEGKNVIVIGGGDTGSDCVGTAKRQGAKEISQFELLPKPPDTRSDSSPWPLWPMMLRTSHAHEEGCEREWSISTKKLSGRNGRVEQLHAARVSMETDKTGRPRFEEVSGSETEVKADLILLAMGFTGPLKDGLLAELGVDLDPRGNVSVDDYYMTSEEGIFAAGDMKRGASLIVWAIREGRDAAAGINRFLSVRKPRS